MASVSHSTFTFNADLGCYTWNLPASLTCPGKTSWCSKHCYACKGQFQFTSVQHAHREHFWWTMHPAFELLVDCELQLLKTSRSAKSRRRFDGRLIVRIHSAGDFYSPEYFEAWKRIARRNPDVVFFCYTRVWHVPQFRGCFQDLPANLIVWCSVDPSDSSLPAWSRLAFVEGSKGAGKLSCAKQTGRGNCTTCSRCHAGKATAVTFKVH